MGSTSGTHLMLQNARPPTPSLQAQRCAVRRKAAALHCQISPHHGLARTAPLISSAARSIPSRGHRRITVQTEVNPNLLIDPGQSKWRQISIHHVELEHSSVFNRLTMAWKLHAFWFHIHPYHTLPSALLFLNPTAGFFPG